MATSSERSPPPFPDSEDQDALDSEEVRGRDSDEDDGEEIFSSAVCFLGADAPSDEASNRGGNHHEKLVLLLTEIQLKFFWKHSYHPHRSPCDHIEHPVMSLWPVRCRKSLPNPFKVA